MPTRRIQTLRDYCLGTAPLLFTESTGHAEMNTSAWRRRSFVVTDVSAALTSVPAELAHLWGDRVALRVFGSDCLDDSLQSLLRRGVDGLCERSAEEGYEYTDEERTMLLLASQGCGHLYGEQGEFRWNVALSPTVQAWDGATKKRVAQSVALELLRQTSVSVRLIVALRGVAVPYEDGPYFDFEVSAIEVSVPRTPQGDGGSDRNLGPTEDDDGYEDEMRASTKNDGGDGASDASLPRETTGGEDEAQQEEGCNDDAGGEMATTAKATTKATMVATARRARRRR